MGTMASRGALEPSRLVVVVLGVLMGGIACALLLVGGLTALQQAAILGAVPFTFVLVGLSYSWITALRAEEIPVRPAVRAAPVPAAAGGTPPIVGPGTFELDAEDREAES
jgi:glycine betaine transporter